MSNLTTSDGCFGSNADTTPVAALGGKRTFGLPVEASMSTPSTAGVARLNVVAKGAESTYRQRMKGLPAGVQYSKRFLTNVIVDFGLSGSICHVGSLLNDKKPGEAQRFREKLAALGISPFVGVDLFPGQNVDIVADLCDPRLFDAHPRLERAFDLLYCSALLEHVPDPFACARTVRRMIKSGGHLYFAGPWVQGYHGYPDDYWRISFSGMRVLFPDIEWRVKWYQGNVSGSEKFTIDFEDPGAERKLFRMSANDLRVPISTRGMANLIIGGLGRARD